jgi:pyruvate dehydrogenase E2 component (dihydrolipoamide acetyltransferase)
MADVILPKMGDAMDEGKIVQWLKKVGDRVEVDDAIAEIETDKSNVEVTVDTAGFVQKIAFAAGDVVPVGQVIAVIGDAPVAEGAPAIAPATPAANGRSNGTAASVTSAGVPAANGTAPEIASVPTPVPIGAAGPAPATSAPSDFKPYESFVGAMPEGLGGSASVIGEPVIVVGGAAAGDNGRVRATPLARAMAQANRVDLAALRGTGPDGAVGKADVEAALAAPAKPAPVTPPTSATGASAQAPAPSESDEVQEYNAMRRTIAKRLTESKQTVPHIYVTAEVDVEAMLALREELNASGADTAAKISINDLVVKAVAVALVENPVINSQFVENKRILKKAVNIGIAVSVGDGLIVPVVRNCESKSVRAIARDSRPLIEKARGGKLAPQDYTGGTFTITNMGSLTPEVESFSGIINPGEGAILAVASIRAVPAVVGGQVVPRKRMNVTISADHRVIDGADCARFLTALKRIIEHPLQILA